MNKTNISVIILLAVVIVFFAFLKIHPSNPAGKIHSIVLTKEGFFPNEATIRQGDTVVFTTTAGEDFWPASDLHPTHGIYPEFDPKQPVLPNSSWSFKFDKVGTWPYHDHLSPLDGGTIIVDNSSDMISLANKDNCQKLVDLGQQRVCWRNLLESTVDKNGLDEGFRLFREIAQLEPEDCHGYAHDLGSYAFAAYSKGKKIQVGEEASYCGYGFWHGFMERFAANSLLDEAKNFCESQMGSTPELLSRIRNSCAHGIGIGLIPDPPSVKFWGQTQPLVEPALEYCDTLKREYSMIENCYAGAFHAMVTYMVEKEYKFVFDKDNFFGLCLLQKEKYRPECYYQIAPKLPGLTHDDLPRVFKLLNQIPSQEVYLRTLDTALINFTNQHMTVNDRIDFFQKCRALEPTLASVCISSMVESIFNTGVPDKEYLKAIELCSSKEFIDSEKSICFEKVLSLSRSHYSKNKVEGICVSIKKVYKNICKD